MQNVLELKMRLETQIRNQFLKNHFGVTRLELTSKQEMKQSRAPLALIKVQWLKARLKIKHRNKNFKFRFNQLATNKKKEICVAYHCIPNEVNFTQ